MIELKLLTVVDTKPTTGDSAAIPVLKTGMVYADERNLDGTLETATTILVAGYLYFYSVQAF